MWLNTIFSVFTLHIQQTKVEYVMVFNNKNRMHNNVGFLNLK